MKNLYPRLTLLLSFLLFSVVLSHAEDVKLPTTNKLTPLGIRPTSFRPLPYLKTFPVGYGFGNSQFYHFNHKDYRFDKIVNRVPILTDKEQTLSSIDPIHFTIKVNKTDIRVGDEIELTVTAELLNISPQLLFTLEELKAYTLKVVLPNTFIQTGGTYYDFATATLSEQTPKQEYTIKGRFIDKPSFEDCFKVLRKLNEDLFILKETKCLEVLDVDFSTLNVNTVEKVEQANENLTPTIPTFMPINLEVQHVFNGKILERQALSPNDNVVNPSCLGFDKYRISHDIALKIINLATLDGVGFKFRALIKGAQDNELFDLNSECYNSYDMSITSGLELKETHLDSNPKSVEFFVRVYNNSNCSGMPVDFKRKITIDTSPCTYPIEITTSANTICPNETATLTAQNCTATVNWSNGSVGTSIQVGAGNYTATCSNNPSVVSNSETITSVSSPQAPTISTNKFSVTPGETANLSADECGGTVKWYGPNNFRHFGRDASVSYAGEYKASCIIRCGNTDYESPQSSGISISVLPLRLEATKYEIYPNESTSVSAFGCTNGYIEWKINGSTLLQSDNPLSASLVGTYEARCRSFDGLTNTGWVSLQITQKASDRPRITASAFRAYQSDDVVLTASGCPSGWFYNWAIPVRQPNGSTVVESRWGTPQTVKGPGTYQVKCWVNDTPLGHGPDESITIFEIRPGDITITPNKTEANPGESVLYTVTGDCPGSGGIHWVVNGLNYWTNRYETFTVYGPGTYTARCETGQLFGNWVSSTIKSPPAGAVTIIADKTKAKPNELVTLRAIGCDKEVVWTLPAPNNTEVRGSAILHHYGPGVYKATCNRFSFTSAPASITIAAKNGDEPVVVQSKSVIAVNEIAELVFEGCPNDWVQWGVPKKDGNGNTYYDYSYFFKTLVIKEPGTYQVRCTSGNYTSFQEIIVHPAATDGLYITASRTKAKPSETTILTAYGCPNGVVQWQNGNSTPTGSRITVTGPGLYKAKCVGDFSNNGDWAMANVRSDGSITPTITASATEACPNEPVTITASCSDYGYYVQLQWVNAGQLDYWLNNRNAVENGGQNYFEVFGIGGSPVTRNGPNIYYARCIKPDFSWMGDFRDKSVTVEPAFPTDLRATNNGPSITGGTSIRLAVTEVPNATYQWVGPAGSNFSSTARNPEIPDLTAAKSGIYTVTLTKGNINSTGCQTTATTEVKITESSFRIKAIDGTTNIETYTLSYKPTSATGFGSLVLSVENIAGGTMTDYTYNWTSSYQTISSPNNSYQVVDRPGIYQVVISRVGSPNWSRKLSVSISGNKTRSEQWSKMKTGAFTNGTPIKIVPLKFSDDDILVIDNRSNTEPSLNSNITQYKTRSYLIQYEANGVLKKELMQVTPDFSYAQSHITWGNDFTGFVNFRDYYNNNFLGGWRFVNGSVVGKKLEYTVTSEYRPQIDDCLITTYEAIPSNGSFDLEEYESRGFELTAVVNLFGKMYGRFIGSVPCYTLNGWSNPIPPNTTPGDSNWPYGQSNTPPVSLPIILGGGILPIRPVNEKLGLLLMDCFSKVFQQEQIHLHRPADITNNTTDSRKFKLLIDLIAAEFKKELNCNLVTPSGSIIDNASTMFANGQFIESANLLAANLLPPGTGCGAPESKYEELSAKIPDIMNRVKSTFLLLSKFLEDCTSGPNPLRVANATTSNPCGGELIVNEIINKIVARGKSPAEVIVNANALSLMASTDMSNLWTDLSIGQVITSNSDNSLTITKLNSTITLSRDNQNNPTALTIENGGTTVVIQAQGLNQSEENYLQNNNLSRNQYIFNLGAAQGDAILFYGPEEGFRNRTGKGNAFLHAVLICRNALTFGVNHSIGLGEAHEMDTNGQPQTTLDSQMDIFNNNVAAQVFQNCIDCSLIQLYVKIKENIDNGNFKYIKNGQLVPTNQ